MTKQPKNEIYRLYVYYNNEGGFITSGDILEEIEMLARKNSRCYYKILDSNNNVIREGYNSWDHQYQW